MRNQHVVFIVLQLDSYEVQLKFHVLSFASKAKVIVDIKQTDISSSTEDVIWNLMEFDYLSRTRPQYSFNRGPSVDKHDAPVCSPVD